MRNRFGKLLKRARRRARPTAAELRRRAGRHANIYRGVGLTQSEAAARAGVAQSEWSAYESGRVIPTVKTAKRLADAVGIGLEKLI